MRIAIVSHSLPPARVGGAEIHVQAYAHALAAAGHTVFVYAARKDVTKNDLSLARETTEGRVHVAWMTNNLFYKNFQETYDRPSTDAAFLQFLDAAQPELIHGHHLQDVGARWPALARDRNPGIPIALTLHDYWLTCPRWGQRFSHERNICHEVDLRVCVECLQKTPWRQPRGASAASAALGAVKALTGVDLAPAARTAARAAGKIRGRVPRGGNQAGSLEDLIARAAFIRERVVPNVDCFIALSRTLAGEMQQFGVPGEKMFISRPGIQTSGLGNVQRVPSDRVRIAFHGQLTVAKAPDLLLEAFARLEPEVRSRATLTLRGLPRDAAFGKQLAAKAAAVGAHIERPFDRSELPGKLAVTDLLVVPSIWWENAPLTILEAQAADVPVLVSDLGGMAELVPQGRGGFRFAAGDVDELARALGTLIREPSQLAAARGSAPHVRTIEEDAAELPGRILQMKRRQ